MIWKHGKAAGRPKSPAPPPVAAPEPTSVADWVRTHLALKPDPIQSLVLESQTRRGLLNCTRQWGKSTISAAKAVHRAATIPGSLTLVISPAARQSAEFVRKASRLVEELGIRPRGDGDNDISLAFPNGSRIVGLPGNDATIRGFSAVSLMLVDEAARVPDDLFNTIRPMLAVSSGALWLMSTPFGKRGFFYDSWANGGDEWERVRVPATECPRIRADFLREEKRTMGDRAFRQEYLCEFVDSVASVFDRDLIARAFTDDVKLMVFR